MDWDLFTQKGAGEDFLVPHPNFTSQIPLFYGSLCQQQPLITGLFGVLSSWMGMCL